MTTLYWPETHVTTNHSPSEVVISDTKVSIYKSKGNWNLFEREPDTCGTVTVGRYIETVWHS